MYTIECPFCNKADAIRIDENDIRNDYYLVCPACQNQVHILLETETGIEKCKTIRIPVAEFRKWEIEHGYRTA